MNETKRSLSVDRDGGRMSQEVDLTTCDREPIHIPGRVQSFGALVAVSSDWIVNHVSANAEAYLGVSTDELLGTPLTEHLRPEAIRTLRGKMGFLAYPDTVERAFGLRLREGGAPVDVALHASGRSIVLEIECAPREGAREQVSSVRPMIDRIAKADTVDALCESAARQLRGLTGFDRVMVYRFGEDESGHVIAESHVQGLEPFLGLRYPASDIPKQARELYRRNLLRIISDTEDAGEIIEPMLNPEGEPLDLSMSTLRAVSPIHIEYLRNMGVGASMSVSILVRGKLWGLFACHHRTPLVLPYGVRTAAELFGQLFGYILDQREGDTLQQDAVRARTLHDRLMSQLAEGSSISENFEAIVEAVGTVVAHDGAVGWIDGAFMSVGQTPTREEFVALARFLNRAAASQVFHTDSIGRVYPNGQDFVERAAGMLVLPVSRSPRDYIVLFRREVVNSVTWAGDPTKPATLGPNGIRLTPRKSFEAWREVVRGQSAPWKPAEVQAASALRMTLLEVVLRMTDAALRDKARAQERQEILIAELNHRVRNILNLIRSLVNQSRGDATSVAQFTEVVGGRIHALARAHDQVTREQWNPASLRELIRTEAEAYLGGKADRIGLSGPDILLRPGAFTTLSLVMHELITNAAKYGALSDSRGQISVGVVPDEDGSVVIGWRESGGPAISQPPSRRGFGTTIIERSIPVDLRGTAELRHEPTGLRATFRIPAQHVAEIVHAESFEDAPEIDLPPPAAGLAGGVLVVEDNMIIALDAEEFMREMGAERVHVAHGVADALRIVGSEDLSFALLDVNLGDETSEPIAQALHDKGIRFAFATGYGETTSLAEQFPGVRFVLKPYDRSKIEQALRAG